MCETNLLKEQTSKLYSFYTIGSIYNKKNLCLLFINFNFIQIKIGKGMTVVDFRISPPNKFLSHQIRQTKMNKEKSRTMRTLEYIF